MSYFAQIVPDDHSNSSYLRIHSIFVLYYIIRYIMACMCKRKESVSLTLLVVGLDNAGKTTMVNSFTGSRDEELVPTFGLIPHEITRKNVCLIPNHRHL